MKQFHKTYMFFLISVLLLSLFNEIGEAKRAGGGGGRVGSSSSRGTSSKGGKGSGGWSSGGGGKIGGSGSVFNGRTVVGTYQTFGSPSRWSLRGGRSYYFVGFPYGHHHYGHGYYRGSSSNNNDETGILNPWVIMILVLVTLNVLGCIIWAIVYYNYK